MCQNCAKKPEKKRKMSLQIVENQYMFNQTSAKSLSWV